MSTSTKLSERQYQGALRAVSALAHEFLVAHRRQWGKKEYIKTTTDANWIQSHGTDQVDLASCPYEDLPEDWKKERDIGSQLALDAVIKAVESGREIDAAFIGEVASMLHDEWVKRNSHRTGDEWKKKYSELSEYEQRKDQLFVLAAVSVLEESDTTDFGRAKDKDLLDLRRVGRDKPIGYLQLGSLQVRGYTVDKVQQELEARGLKTLVLSDEESDIESGALYVWDHEALGVLLKNNHTILDEAGWPSEPEAFVRHLKVTAPPKSKLFDLIADAFGDTKNPLRSEKVS